MATSGVMADFGRMPASRKVLVFVVIGALLGLLYFRFVYRSLKADVTAAEAKLKVSASANATLEADIPRFAQLRAKKEILDATIVEHQKALPTEAEVPAFFETVERKITEAGVEVVKWNKKIEEPIEAFVKVPLDVELTGTFLQLKRFFASLVEKKKPKNVVPGQGNGVEERERVVSIENLVLSQPTVRNREIFMTAKFTAVTFRQEDKAPAAPGAPGSVPENSPPPGSSPDGPAPSAPPPLPSSGGLLGAPAAAKARVEDALQKSEQRVKDGTTDPGAGSARLKGGL